VYISVSSVGSIPLSQWFTRSLTITVLYPQLPLNITAEDPLLNAVRGWTLPRPTGICSIQAFQTTQIYARTTFSPRPSSTSTTPVLVNHLLTGAIRSLSTAIATVDGLFVTGNMEGSATIMVERNGRPLGQVRVTVDLQPVDVIHFTVVHSKSLTADFSAQDFLPLGVQSFTVELDDSLDSVEESSELVTAAIFSDGHYYTLSGNVGLKYAALDRSFLTVSNMTITPVASGTGRFLQVDWNSLCDNSNILRQAKTYTIALEQPTGITVVLEHQFIAHEDDTIARQATFPASSRIRVTGTRSNDIIDATNYLETSYMYNQTMIEITNDGTGGLIVRAVSSSVMGEVPITVRYMYSSNMYFEETVTITVVTPSGISATLAPYPSYTNSEDYSVTTLGRYGSSDNEYQKAMIRTLLQLQANGVDVHTFELPYSVQTITYSEQLFSATSDGVLEPQRDGTTTLNIVFSSYTTSVTATVSSADIIEVTSIDRFEIIPMTLSGLPGEVTGSIEADVTFSDGTKYYDFYSGGRVAISDLLTLNGDIIGVFNVSEGGAVTLLGNAPDAVTITAMGDNTTDSSVDFYCNLESGDIELDMGGNSEAPIPRIVSVGNTIRVPVYINAGSTSFSIIEIAVAYDPSLLRVLDVYPSSIWPSYPRADSPVPFYLFESSRGLFDGVTLFGGILTEVHSDVQHIADIEFEAINETNYAAFVSAEIVVLMDDQSPPQPITYNPSPAATMSIAIGSSTNLPPSSFSVPAFYYESSVPRCTDPLPCICTMAERGDLNGDCVTDLLDVLVYYTDYMNTGNTWCTDRDFAINGRCELDDVQFLLSHIFYLSYFVEGISVNPVTRSDCFLRFGAQLHGRANSVPHQERVLFMVSLAHNDTDFQRQITNTLPVNGLGETATVQSSGSQSVGGGYYRAKLSGSDAVLVTNSEILQDDVGVVYTTAVYGSSGEIVLSSLHQILTTSIPPVYPEAIANYVTPPRTMGYPVYSFLGFSPFATFSQNLTSPDCINVAAAQFWPRYRVSVVPEDSQINTTVAFVFANDSDANENAQLTYSFAGGFLRAKNDTFSIDPTTGNITLLRSLDRETLDIFANITVEARDAGFVPRMGIGYITIMVGDINDNPPMFTQPLYTTLDPIPEATPLNTTVIQVQATDMDIDRNADIMYSISDSDPSDDFSIDINTGEIKIMTSLDYETHRNYTLTILAEDGGNPTMSDTTIVEITVSPSNDHVPMCTPDYLLALLVEDYPVGTQIATLVASDADIGSDHAELTFSLIQHPEGYHELFNINQLNDTHAILLTNVSGVFNRFEIPEYNIMVLVEDVGQLNCTIDVEVRVAEGSRFFFEPSYRPGYLTGFVQKEVGEKTTTYTQSVEFFEKLYSNDIY